MTKCACLPCTLKWCLCCFNALYTESNVYQFTTTCEDYVNTCNCNQWPSGGIPSPIVATVGNSRKVMSYIIYLVQRPNKQTDLSFFIFLHSVSYMLHYQTDHKQNQYKGLWSVRQWISKDFLKQVVEVEQLLCPTVIPKSTLEHIKSARLSQHITKTLCAI